MVKTAARLWNIPESEIETNFDPLITLLLDACASELERTHQHINAAQNRLLDRLSEVLLPDVIMNVQPASCIISARSAEAFTDIDPQSSFSVVQSIQPTGAKPYTARLSFTPVGRFRLHPVSLDYMFCGNRVTQFLPQGNRENIYEEGAASANRMVHEFYLAFQPGKELRSLKGLQLFFDMRGHSEAVIFYNSLAGATAFAGDEPLALQHGYADGEQFDLTLEDSLADEGSDYSRKICRQAARIYERHFLHFAADQLPAAGQLPSEWQQRLPQPVLQKIPVDKLIFIKIKLSRPVHQNLLDRLACGINAFPAINRHFNTVNLHTDSRLNIVPLPVTGDFLDLNAVYGPGGQPYKFRVSADALHTEGEAIIRSGGIGKTNSKELRGLISSLIETIRDESAYFSRMSNEFVLSRLKEINRILVRLEDRINVARDNKETLHYLLLKPRTAEETVTAEYWTVNKPEEAHSLKAGSKLTPQVRGLLSTDGCYTLTNTVGARSGLSDKEKQYLLKRKLASGEKIVSAEDVRLLCLQLFGQNLKKAETRKSTQPGQGKQQGFATFIDVALTLHSVQDKEDIEFTRRQAEYLLQENGSFIYPFRVRISS